MSFERKDERQPSKKKFKIRETTRFCKGNDAYRGEIFGGQQPVRHGEINSGGLDSFLFRFFFYHDHTNRCCCCCCSIVVVVVLIAFQRSDGKISTRRLTATVRLLLLLRRRSSPTGGKRRRDRKRERKRTHQYSKRVQIRDDR